MVSFLMSSLTLLFVVCFSRPGALAFTIAKGSSSKQLNDAIAHQPRTTLSMATKTYDYKQPRPFVMPLLQDSDVVQEFGDTASSTVDDDDDIIIDYLPWFVLQQQTPQAKQFIVQATRQHVFGDTRSDPKVNVTSLLTMIKDEFKLSDVPVVIGGNTYENADVARILSFAAHHRLPKEIAALLFGNTEELKVYKQDFLESGWNNVLLPRGLAIRLPRNRLSSKLDRYQPIPRQFLAKRNCHVADRAIREAARIQAPPRRLLSREAFLNSLQKEMASSSIMSTREASLPFFPSNQNMFTMLRRSVVKTKFFLRIASRKLQESIRATVLSYSVLAFSWYNASFLWQWQRLSASFALSTASSFPLASSLHRVGAVMANVGSLPFNGPLSISVALGLAPLAHKVLSRHAAEHPNKALIFLCSVLAVAHVGIGAGVLFVDAAILRSVILLP